MPLQTLKKAYIRPVLNKGIVFYGMYMKNGLKTILDGQVTPRETVKLARNYSAVSIRHLGTIDNKLRIVDRVVVDLLDSNSVCMSSCSLCIY